MIFVDAGAWFALVDEADAHHHESERFFRLRMRKHAIPSVTTEYVLVETLTLLRMRLGVGAVRRFLTYLEGAKRLDVVWITQDRYTSGLRVMLRHQDKRWSFTDCVSLALMWDLGLEDAFTFDHNFTQAGFRIHP